MLVDLTKYNGVPLDSIQPRIIYSWQVGDYVYPQMERSVHARLLVRAMKQNMSISDYVKSLLDKEAE